MCTHDACTKKIPEGETIIMYRQRHSVYLRSLSPHTPVFYSLTQVAAARAVHGSLHCITSGVHVHYSELPALPLADYRRLPCLVNSKSMDAASAAIADSPSNEFPSSSYGLFGRKSVGTVTEFKEGETDSDSSEQEVDSTVPMRTVPRANSIETATKTMRWVWPPEETKEHKQLYGGLTASFHDAELFMHLEEHLQVACVCIY